MFKCAASKDHKTFTATAYVTQTWEIDENGDFIDSITECDEVLKAPNSESEAICSTCGKQADWV